MDSQDQRKMVPSGHDGHGMHICHRCGWPFPNPHPSSKHRRAHKRVCGTIEGYKIEGSEVNPQLGVSDDEHSDEERRQTSALKLEKTSAKEISSAGIGEGSTGSEKQVFLDANTEFSDSAAAVSPRIEKIVEKNQSDTRAVTVEVISESSRTYNSEAALEKASSASEEVVVPIESEKTNSNIESEVDQSLIKHIELEGKEEHTVDNEENRLFLVTKDLPVLDDPEIMIEDFKDHKKVVSTPPLDLDTAKTKPVEDENEDNDRYTPESAEKYVSLSEVDRNSNANEGERKKTTKPVEDEIAKAEKHVGDGNEENVHYTPESAEKNIPLSEVDPISNENKGEREKTTKPVEDEIAKVEKHVGDGNEENILYTPVSAEKNIPLSEVDPNSNENEGEREKTTKPVEEEIDKAEKHVGDGNEENVHYAPESAEKNVPLSEVEPKSNENEGEREKTTEPVEDEISKAQKHVGDGNEVNDRYTPESAEKTVPLSEVDPNSNVNKGDHEKTETEICVVEKETDLFAPQFSDQNDPYTPESAEKKVPLSEVDSKSNENKGEREITGTEVCVVEKETDLFAPQFSDQNVHYTPESAEKNVPLSKEYIAPRDSKESPEQNDDKSIKGLENNGETEVTVECAGDVNDVAASDKISESLVLKEPEPLPVEDKLNKQKCDASAADISVDSASQTDSLEGNWGSASALSFQSDAPAAVDTETPQEKTEKPEPEKPQVATEGQRSDKSEAFRQTTGIKHTPLMNLLGETKTESKPNSDNPKQTQAVAEDKKAAATAVDDQAAKREMEKEYNSPAKYPTDTKGKRKAKGKPYWVPFVCCSSVN